MHIYALLFLDSGDSESKTVPFSDQRGEEAKVNFFRLFLLLWNGAFEFPFVHLKMLDEVLVRFDRVINGLVPCRMQPVWFRGILKEGCLPY